MSGVDDTASDPNLYAAEYVFGTLDPGERAAMIRAFATDADAAGGRAGGGMP
ncbi:hypothetical protein [Methylobacterium sp. J-077]|uniref:hypothetical protein n=1 Tax=Methylobacterium sp. J-077 TaxID=2836656 RepID=UPI001FBA89FD|nr:hypothetical protein [Methylobacterium sp. J-077]MCJ2123427.1 hypothetical protein [Methylobacterium sp. J-077]